MQLETRVKMLQNLKEKITLFQSNPEISLNTEKPVNYDEVIIQISKLKNEYDEKFNSLSTTIASSLSTPEELHQQFDSLKAAESTLRLENSKLVSENNALNEQFETAKKEFEKVNQRVLNLESELSFQKLESGKRLVELEQENLALKSQLQESAVKVYRSAEVKKTSDEEQHCSTEHFQAETEELRIINKSLIDENEKLAEQLKQISLNYEKHAEEQKEKIKQLSFEIEELKAKLLDQSQLNIQIGHLSNELKIKEQVMINY